MRRPWAIAAMAVAGVVMATGWASSIASSSPPPPAPDWVMIQGRVSQRSVQWATVITPPWRPYCAPGTLCPMVIIAGRVYRVRLVGSVDETAAGMPSAGCSLSLLIDTYVLMHKLVRLGRQASRAAP
ncbi:MAG: hypothetical protein M1600_01090 [Firmicutes bacterium]|nr:hypothetical protein [Bacillota bacterium]